MIGQLTADQDTTAIASILTKLNAHGVTQATLQRLAPSALTAGPYDMLAHIRRADPHRGGIANRGCEE